MRLVNIPFRDVKPKRLVLHPQPRLPPRPFRLYMPDTRLSSLGYGKGTRRCFSKTSLKGSENPLGLLLSGLSDNLSVPRKIAGQQQQQNQNLPLIQETRIFGKWQGLLTDQSRLAVETDFDRRGPAQLWRGRLLVDKLENYGDLALWSCLLDYQKRINGDSGVLKVWTELWGRKSLYDVQSPLAPVFWQTILDASVRSGDTKFLNGAWIYSEWMYDLHAVKWPRLYSTILTHFLRTHQHHQVLKWQLRLNPNFYPGAEEFARIIKEFAGDHELYRVPTLESLYVVNPDHQLYDILVPYLYDLGASQLARKWRRICILHDDPPLTPLPVRPFLRFQQGYFPHEPLDPKESAAIANPGLESVDDNKQIELSREFINRVHGGTFGIGVKKYNDRLGAKWFASSWVSLDIAISTISALGIDQIGPLSLQSIALREGTPEGVLGRIEQLRERGISVVDSTYLRLVLYLARIKDNELLLDLLNSDLHPDVFDDSEMQARLILSTARSEDWLAHRLLLATRLVSMEASAREAANTLAHAYILRQDWQGLSRLLDDMRAMRIPVNSQPTCLIFETLVSEAKSTYIPKYSLYFYISICRKLASMEVAVPVRCWRKILFSLARQGRIDDLEKLCVELVDLFTSSLSSRPGFVSVHPDDIPEPMRKPLSSVENLLGIYVPLDLPTQTPLHPLRQIFDSKLMGTIVRYSIYFSLDRRVGAAPVFQTRLQRPFGSDCGRVVRLMRTLRDKGLFVHGERLATWVKVRLVTLYGPDEPLRRAWQVVRARNSMPLPQMKALLDEAWGEEFLPPIDELRADIEKRGRKVMLRNRKYLQNLGKSTPHLHVVL
ncbi:hypothetical protein AAE478_004796 [Parahypoxylon ruwenzoriense]